MNIDESLKNKEALVEEAQKLAAEEDVNKAAREASALNRKWKFSDEESLSEKELREKFEEAINVIYAKRNEMFGSVEEIKKNIISKAKEVAELTNFKDATNKMNDLMAEWKTAGHLSKEQDDELWNEFNAIKQAFYDKKAQAYEEFKVKAAKAVETKEKLVAKAKELATSTEFKKTGEELNKLFEEWKQAGRSNDSKVDDELWKQFQEARKNFYDARDAYYKEMRKVYAARVEEKEKLVVEALDILENKEFGKEVTAKIKGLRDKWKEIGSAGKEKEDEIWSRFNGAINKYFEGLKEHNETRHEEWVSRMQESVAYKKSQIEKLKKDIIREEQNAKESLRESAQAEAQEVIAEKNDYIAKLENDIKDIEEKLNK